jgi:hypothetical protein
MRYLPGNMKEDAPFPLAEAILHFIAGIRKSEAQTR